MIPATFTEVDHRELPDRKRGIRGEAPPGEDCKPVPVEIRVTKVEARVIIHELMEWLSS